MRRNAGWGLKRSARVRSPRTCGSTGYYSHTGLRSRRSRGAVLSASVFTRSESENRTNSLGAKGGVGERESSVPQSMLIKLRAA